MSLSFSISSGCSPYHLQRHEEGNDWHKESDYQGKAAKEFQNDGSVGGACRNSKALGPLKSLFPTLADLRVPMSNEVGSNPDPKKQRKVPDIGQENLKQSRSDKASKVKDDANGQRSQGNRETREGDRTTAHSLEQYPLPELPHKKTSEKTSREPSSPSEIRLVAEEPPLAALAFGKNQDLSWPLLLNSWHAGEYSTRTGVVSESVLALESGVEVGAPSPTFLGHIS
jgi:hypothetical protein